MDPAEALRLVGLVGADPPLPGPALGRRAAAGGDRAGDRQAARRPALRRAHRRARLRDRPARAAGARARSTGRSAPPSPSSPTMPRLRAWPTGSSGCGAGESAGSRATRTARRRRSSRGSGPAAAAPEGAARPLASPEPDGGGRDGDGLRDRDVRDAAIDARVAQGDAAGVLRGVSGSPTCSRAPVGRPPRWRAGSRPFPAWPPCARGWSRTSRSTCPGWTSQAPDGWCPSPSSTSRCSTTSTSAAAAGSRRGTRTRCWSARPSAAPTVCSRAIPSPPSSTGGGERLRVVGLALSPEYVYEIRGLGDIFPDNRRFGVVWMGARALGAAFQMEGAFNDVALALAPGASEADVIDAVDRLLAPYGGTGAYGRADHLSDMFVSSEIEETQITSVLIPSIFLGVTAFLLNMVLSRLVATAARPDRRAQGVRLRRTPPSPSTTSSSPLGPVLAGAVAGHRHRHLAGGGALADLRAVLPVPDRHLYARTGAWWARRSSWPAAPRSWARSAPCAGQCGFRRPRRCGPRRPRRTGPASSSASASSASCHRPGGS